ncbi:unnamed protein product [Brachionus calyciflorus]|uniref:Amine oxidase domain-containing protein n=1 Tax=Brachionus calyciflorus TaxID=104777 RepID=A0A813M7F6_9BILA|nr:unnamed protein product [Brachionus calyciflorus]
MQYSFTKTAIIGAGISGISTAIKLLENNYDEFLIFEANDRIGGRINTIPYGNSFLELGAQYIHGQVNNPIYKLALENRLIEDKYKEILDETDDLTKENIYSDNNGVRLDEKLLDWAQFCFYNAYNLAHDLKHETNQNLGEFIYENYIRLMTEKLDPIVFKNEINQNLIDAIFQWNFKWECMFNGCESLFDMSLKNFKNYTKLDGCQIIEFNNGYKSLLQSLIGNFQENFEKNLKLNFELKNILLCHKLKNDINSECEHCKHTDDENKIVLLFDKDRVVLCERVLCTMSLGFFKENFENMIRPSALVPNEKLDAIKRMGFGTVNKIILVYEKPFWNENLELINPIWNIESREKMFETLKNKNVKTRWFEDICSFCTANNNKNVLIGWIAGNYHESLSNDEIKRDCTILLRKFLGREDIPEPIDLVRSNWYSNRFTRGSYSFYAYETFDEDTKRIAKPISFNNKIFIQFAGEATHDNFYSTVHGAYLTGLREADRIIKDL